MANPAAPRTLFRNQTDAPTACSAARRSLAAAVQRRGARSQSRGGGRQGLGVLLATQPQRGGAAFGRQKRQQPVKLVDEGRERHRPPGRAGRTVRRGEEAPAEVVDGLARTVCDLVGGRRRGEVSQG